MTVMSLMRVGCFRRASRPKHEVRDPAVQPEGVLPRAAPAVTLPQLPQSGGG